MHEELSDNHHCSPKWIVQHARTQGSSLTSDGESDGAGEAGSALMAGLLPLSGDALLKSLTVVALQTPFMQVRPMPQA